MYVLHALFSEAGSWELWAEDSRRDRHAPPARKGPKGAPSPAARHPFAAEPAELARVLAGAGPAVADSLTGADVRGAVPLALPSGARGPVPSERLARLATSAAPSGSADAPKLRAWIVPTLVLDPAAGAGLLDALGEDDVLAVYDEDGTERELPLDPTVRYAHAVATFAGALVGRGALRPTLGYDPEAEGYFAGWVPDYTLETAAHRRSLVAAMPPSFRCQLLNDSLDGRRAGEVFDGALEALVDAYATAAFTGPHGLHGEPLAPPCAAAGRPWSGSGWTR